MHTRYAGDYADKRQRSLPCTPSVDNLRPHRIKTSRPSKEFRPPPSTGDNCYTGCATKPVDWPLYVKKIPLHCRHNFAKRWAIPERLISKLVISSTPYRDVPTKNKTKTRKAQHSQEFNDPCRQCCRDSKPRPLTFWPQNLSWNICVSGLVIAAASIFEISCG